jgi:hypothetical protein
MHCHHMVTRSLGRRSQEGSGGPSSIARRPQRSALAPGAYCWIPASDRAFGWHERVALPCHRDQFRLLEVPVFLSEAAAVT